MKEVKPSKKPLAIYYAIVLLVLLVINLVVMPWLICLRRSIQKFGAVIGLGLFFEVR